MSINGDRDLYVWQKFIENPDYYMCKNVGDDDFLFNNFEFDHYQQDWFYSRVYGEEKTKTRYYKPEKKIKDNKMIYCIISNEHLYIVTKSEITAIKQSFQCCNDINEITNETSNNEINNYIESTDFGRGTKNILPKINFKEDN